MQGLIDRHRRRLFETLAALRAELAGETDPETCRTIGAAIVYAEGRLASLNAAFT